MKILYVSWGGYEIQGYSLVSAAMDTKKDVSRVFSKLLYLDDIIFCLEKNRVFSIYVSGEN